MTVREHVQRFDLGQEVTLYELDLTEFGLGIVRFTPATEDNNTAIGFGGETYAPHPMRAEGFELTSAGALPRPSLSVSNLDNSFTALVDQNDDLHGATLTRIRTYGRYLDDGDDPDGEQHLPLDIYTVVQKTEHTLERISWQCAAAMDQESVELPARTIVRDFCDHTVRRWDPVAAAYDYVNVTCPWVGAAKNENGAPCAPADEVFSKKLKTCCQARFGVSAVLPTRAFPGVSKIRVKG